MVRLTVVLNWNNYHNIPKKYIQRRMFKGVVYENTHQMTPTVVYDYTKHWIYDENAPWTSAAMDSNDPTKTQGQWKEMQLVVPLKDWYFYRGDRVEIMRGKDAGKQGLINGIIKQRNWVFVSGLNCELTGYNLGRNVSDVSYMQKERPLVVHRDVKLVDPSDLKPCEVEHRFTEAGEKVRVSKRTGQVIPIPPDAEETADYAKKSAYKPGEKDTTPEEHSKVTFVASYATFEEDLRKEYGMEKDKQRAPTFIY